MAQLTPEEQREFARRKLGLSKQAEIDRLRLNQDYNVGSNRLQEESRQGQREVGDQLASQGLFNSGIRINEQGNIVREFNEALGDLGLDRSRGLEDLARGLSTNLAQVDANMASALAEANRREQDEIRRRAELEALRRAATTSPPPMPPSIITLAPPAPPALTPQQQAALARLQSGVSAAPPKPTSGKYLSTPSGIIKPRNK